MGYICLLWRTRPCSGSGSNVQWSCSRRCENVECSWLCSFSSLPSVNIPSTTTLNHTPPYHTISIPDHTPAYHRVWHAGTPSRHSRGLTSLTALPTSPVSTSMMIMNLLCWLVATEVETFLSPVQKFHQMIWYQCEFRVFPKSYEQILTSHVQIITSSSCWIWSRKRLVCVVSTRR